MIDLRKLRQDPQSLIDAIKRRGDGVDTDAIHATDREMRQIQVRLQTLQEKRNALSREIGEKKSRGEATTSLRDHVETIKNTIASDRTALASMEEKLSRMTAIIPNILDPDVPPGKGEQDNRPIRQHGTIRSEDGLSDHVALGEALKMLDFSTAAAMSGARFVALYDDLARLERALGTFMLDCHRRFGYREMSVPFLVRETALFGTGQLPKFARDLYRTGDDLWLIPTAEVPLINSVRERILTPDQLPMRLCGLSPCFRSEAGAAGRDTRGLIRMHQFHKVELVSITDAEQSPEELERMTSCAEHILKSLNLAWRVVLLCGGDTGFSAAKTYDIEVWMAGEKRWREISSCSNCRDFQARRINCRLRGDKKGEKKNAFVHTLNGSGLAIGRAMAALLENGQEQNGTIALPDALHPYMDGQTHIHPAHIHPNHQKKS